MHRLQPTAFSTIANFYLSLKVFRQVLRTPLNGISNVLFGAPLESPSQLTRERDV
jgi:hypothetical protein